MKILGIVVEYNPFHTGHLYHLEKAKEIVQPDLTIAIMSGNYVQRGEVAIIDKFKRSELAIKYGVDLVIELPFVYVSQSADYFCKGAIDLLYHIGVTDLVFGSECGTIETFKEIAYAIEKQPDTYNQYLVNQNSIPSLCSPLSPVTETAVFSPCSPAPPVPAQRLPCSPVFYVPVSVSEAAVPPLFPSPVPAGVSLSAAPPASVHRKRHRIRQPKHLPVLSFYIP